MCINKNGTKLTDLPKQDGRGLGGRRKIKVMKKIEQIGVTSKFLSILS
jgi:hypothetical protein